MAQKSAVSLTQTRIADGWWEGVLSGSKEAAATVQAWHQDRQIEGVEVTTLDTKPAQYAVRVPIPAWILTEGLQTVVLRVEDEVKATFTIVAGLPLDEDLRAEVSLLREELDLLKRAFRRHCAGTAG